MSIREALLQRNPDSVLYNEPMDLKKRTELWTPETFTEKWRLWTRIRDISNENTRPIATLEDGTTVFTLRVEIQRCIQNLQGWLSLRKQTCPKETFGEISAPIGKKDELVAVQRLTEKTEKGNLVWGKEKTTALSSEELGKFCTDKINIVRLGTAWLVFGELIEQKMQLTDAKLNWSLAEEKERVSAAISQAEEEGIMKVQIINPNGERDCVILLGRHVGQHISTANDLVLEDETKLFQFAHLLQKNEVRSPVFCEGQLKGNMRNTIDMRNPALGHYRDEQAQRNFYEHPLTLISVMKSVASVSKNTTLANWQYWTTYTSIEGIHSLQIHEKLCEVVIQRERLLSAFYTKYRLPRVDISVAIPISLGKSRLGKPGVCIQGEWHDAMQVLHDCDAGISFWESASNLLHEREVEQVECLVESAPNTMPIAYAGKGHMAGMVNECVRRNFRIHLLQPKHSTWNTMFEKDEGEEEIFKTMKECILTTAKNAGIDI